MAKIKYGLHVNFVAGTIFGLCIGIILSTWCRTKFIPCATSFSKPGCCSDMIQLNINIEANSGNDAIKATSAVHKKSSNIFIEKAEEKGFLFIGVMTAQKYLDSRVVAAHNTWARTINGKVAFFSSEGSTSKYNVPVVSLKNVDDSYPPQKKSFRMIKYMCDHLFDKYEWFMRVDDDAFLKGDKLEKFLRSINGSRPQFIGQAGVGTKEEIGTLSLGQTDNYCMGGPGIAFSKETLRRMCPHIKHCAGNMYTTHEDVEIGRCVRQHAGIPCTWAFEMQKLFYQNFKEYHGSFEATLYDSEVQRAITMHPVKTPIHQYRVYNHFAGRKIMDFRQKELILQREINEMDQVLNEQKSKLNNKYGFKPSVMTYLPTSGKDIIGWEFISRSISSHRNVNPRKGLSGYIQQSLDGVVSQTVDVINKNSRQRGRTIDFKEILYGYVQTDPLNGANYILDILLTYRKHKGKLMTVPVRRHAYMHQTFTQTEFIEDPSVSLPDNISSSHTPVFHQFRGNSELSKNLKRLEETIHFIVPLAGKVKEFQRFMRIYEEICLKRKENAQMHIVLFTKDSSDIEVENILRTVGHYQKTYGGKYIEVIEAEGNFARASALDLGAKQCSKHDLLFCVDVDILLTVDSLNRIRLNTIEGTQVYYPIVFSQYNPSTICKNSPICAIDDFDFSSDMGYWRQFGYGIAAFYKSDLDRIGGYDTSIQGWGKEDVDLFQKVIESNLTIFRAVDVGMVHAFHLIHCDVNLVPAQFQMCVGSKATCLGSQRQLAEMVLEMKDILHRHEDGTS